MIWNMLFLDNKTATFYNSDLEKLPKKTCNIEWSATASEKMVMMILWLKKLMNNQLLLEKLLVLE